mmetsp:Transcript_5487/g.14827  ORF Transcript_5487/g.14827 Transcript_5487/m.14827 type:complete len:146 (-) Transcript_5487:1637-2074(-)
MPVEKTGRPNTWALELQQLVHDAILTGFALLTPTSVASPVVGETLQKEFGCDEAGGDLPPTAQVFLSPFNALDCNVETLPLLGQRLLVVRQGPNAIYAVGSRRRLNCGAIQLPHIGVLVATWDRSTPAQSAVTALEASTHRLRWL